MLPFSISLKERLHLLALGLRPGAIWPLPLGQKLKHEVTYIIEKKKSKRAI